MRGARYRIVVRGELDSRFAYLFNGMQMDQVEGTTVVTGEVSTRRSCTVHRAFRGAQARASLGRAVEGDVDEPERKGRE